MNQDDKRVLEALDMLALALTDHNHQWTIGQRGAYEEAVSILKNRQNSGAIMFPSEEEQRSAKLAEDIATSTNK